VQVETISVLSASCCIDCLMCSKSVPWCSRNRLAYRICTELLNTVWINLGRCNILKTCVMPDIILVCNMYTFKFEVFICESCVADTQFRIYAVGIAQSV
jgi:hypothetical protein